VFGKLPDLLDRNFAIGFYLPGAMLIGAVALVLHAFQRLPIWLSFESAEKFANAVIVAAIAWLAAIALVAINRPLVRMLEGYPYKDLWLFTDLGDRWKARFRKRVVPVLEFQEGIDTARRDGTPEPTQPANHATNLLKAVGDYPDRADLMLPTGFGNRYRAIEVYSRVVYGLDAIPAWPRLEALMPQEFQARIGDARAQFDFAVNVFFVGFVGTSLYLGLAVTSRTAPSLWLLVVTVAILVFGFVSALTALNQFGVYVKSAFDLYRKDLADQLGLELPRSPGAEREMWTEVTRVIGYRSAAAWDRLTKYRKPGGREIG
jgi:hypothetical protein